MFHDTREEVHIMYRILMIILMLSLAAGCSSSPNSADPDPLVQAIKNQYEALADSPYSIDTVSRVIDGDTFETASGDKVRLIGVNTPEISGKAEYYGQEASAYAKERLLNKQVVLFQDAGNTDRYGRLLRYVFIAPEPVMFNETLVKEGYANTMTVAPNVAFAEHFASLEREARSAGAGLWGGEGVQKNETVQMDQPKPSASTTESAPASTACSSPAIKGNINSKKEKIYHVPGSRYYEQTVAEQLFCTEAEAEAAGFRKPKG